MPWKIEARNGKQCVIRTSDGKNEKCHDDRAAAVAHMRALYANENKSVSGFSVKQDSNGIWHWMGIVSNNWLDKQFEWISAKAHQRYVDLIDTGKFGPIVLDSWLTDLPGNVGDIFKSIGERGTPDLWYWHIPVPIGFSTVVAYDDRDYLIAAGQQKPGPFYSSIFKSISESDTNHGMSHGMAKSFVKRDPENERVISEYLSTEFTALPDVASANIGTAFSVAMKEAVMRIPEEKAKRMTDIFGSETMAQFDALLGELEIFAEDSEIPRKETAMKDQKTTKAKVEEVETEEVDETETEETEETEVVDEVVAESTESDVSEEADDEAETGMGIRPPFTVPTDFKAFAEEMATALKEVVVDLQAQQDIRFTELEQKMDEQRTEFARFRESEDDRIAAKAAETPIASMAGWLASEVGSVIGKEDARINGNTDRKLFNKTKADESEEQVTVVPGVSKFVSDMITRQQGRGGSIRVPTSNGQ